MKLDLIQGDCLIEMKNIPDKSIDMILCDLPYGNGKTACKWDTSMPLDKLWEQYNRIIKDNGIIALFGMESFTAVLVVSNINMFRYSWIWKKDTATGHLNANYKPLNITENISIFSKGTIGSLSKHAIRYYPQNIIEVNKQKQNNPNST